MPEHQETSQPSSIRKHEKYNLKKHILSGKIKKIQLCRCFCCLFCLLFVLVCLCTSHRLCHALSSQQAGERWQGDSGQAFAQTSAFFPLESGLTTEEISRIQEYISSQLTAASIGADSRNPGNADNSGNQRIWYDCYSSQCGKMTLKGTRQNTAEALVTAVGGDFFLLHIPGLVSGNYFQDTDIMQDRVILDTTLAWQLFGSVEVAGMEVTIQGKTCLVAGVVSPETDYASRAAYGTMPRMYISYPLYRTLLQEAYPGFSSATEDAVRIDCYEAILPNPVRDFAEHLLQQAVAEHTDSTQQKQVTILENTERYSLSGRYESLKHIREFVISDTVTYPHWENAARIVSFDTALLLLLGIFFSIYPVIYFLWLCWKVYRLADRLIHQKQQAFRNRYRSGIQTEPKTD